MSASTDDTGTQHPQTDDHAAWWAALSLEDRYMAIETVRLDQDPDGGLRGPRPTGERAEFVRRQPEYLERFAGADNIARQDTTGLGLDPVPDAHADTQPLVEDDAGGQDEHRDQRHP